LKTNNAIIPTTTGMMMNQLQKVLVKSAIYPPLIL
jgi:hypothetical protein